MIRKRIHWKYYFGSPLQGRWFGGSGEKGGGLGQWVRSPRWETSGREASGAGWGGVTVNSWLRAWRFGVGHRGNVQKP